MKAVGVDIGGTGIKAAVVDTASGELVTERVRLLTPQPATPLAVADTVHEVLGYLGADAVDLPLGCTFPGVLKDGVARMGFHMDPGWLGLDVAATISRAVDGRPVTVLNDADAAGIAEATYGAAAGVAGTVLLVTVGTGLGTALLVDGTLVPNTELGHLTIDGHDAELTASGSARERNGWKRARWAPYFDRYLNELHRLLWPDLIVLGGGGAKKPEQWLGLLTVPCEVRMAALGNLAGIVGAAASA